jgi:hypothetical protein
MTSVARITPVQIAQRLPARADGQRMANKWPQTSPIWTNTREDETAKIPKNRRKAIGHTQDHTRSVQSPLLPQKTRTPVNAGGFIFENQTSRRS